MAGVEWDPISGQFQYVSSRTKNRRSIRIKQRLAARDGLKCYLCGRSDLDIDTLRIEHRIPRSRGGSRWGMWNLRLACPPCDIAKGDLTEGEFRRLLKSRKASQLTIKEAVDIVRQRQETQRQEAGEA